MHYCETLIEINCFEFKKKKQLINFFLLFLIIKQSFAIIIFYI